MAISVQNKKRRNIHGAHGARLVRRTALDGLAPAARSNFVRWFDPIVGRWLSEDPSGLGPGSNPYRYCGNAPTDGVDPSGLEDWMIYSGQWRAIHPTHNDDPFAYSPPPPAGPMPVAGGPTAGAELSDIIEAADNWNKDSPGSSFSPYYQCEEQAIQLMKWLQGPKKPWKYWGFRAFGWLTCRAPSFRSF